MSAIAVPAVPAIPGDVLPPPRDLASLVALLRFRAERQAGQTLYTFLADGQGDETSITYGELDRRARAIAVALSRRGLAGERALLVYPSGLEYMAAFFGCLYAGVVAVPVYPPRPARRTVDPNLLRIRAIAQDARPRVALTTSAVLSRTEELSQEVLGPFSCEWLLTDAVADDLAASWSDPGATGPRLLS
jgi:acyl-CoA synthetase (AMP-forming)/AMP-acid ligase II